MPGGNVCLVSLLNTAQFSTIRSLLIQYNLLNAVVELDNGTVYLPTNSAFENISAILATLTPEQVVQVLLYHVAPSRIQGSGLTSLCTLLGKPILATPYTANNVCILSSCYDAEHNTDVNVVPSVLLPLEGPSCLL